MSNNAFLCKATKHKSTKNQFVSKYIHHYTNEGMEEKEFEEDSEDLWNKIYNYHTIQYIGQTDEDYTDDE